MYVLSLSLRDLVCVLVVIVFFFKQKTAYEMRISDWSSDVCSSDLSCAAAGTAIIANNMPVCAAAIVFNFMANPFVDPPENTLQLKRALRSSSRSAISCRSRSRLPPWNKSADMALFPQLSPRSEEHTSELQ